MAHLFALGKKLGGALLENGGKTSPNWLASNLGTGLFFFFMCCKNEIDGLWVLDRKRCVPKSLHGNAVTRKTWEGHIRNYRNGMSFGPPSRYGLAPGVDGNSGVLQQGLLPLLASIANTDPASAESQQLSQWNITRKVQ